MPVLDDTVHAGSMSTNRIILHTGKIYYDLLKARAAHSLTDSVALVRIEELAPFPFDALGSVLASYQQSASSLPEIFWLQEEPRNQGAWTHVAPRIASVLDSIGWGGSKLGYLGRREDAVPSVGIGGAYKEQQSDVIESAFRGL